MIFAELNGIHMNFKTLPTLFSPNALDAGTRAMLSCARFQQGDKILDLGCGYGFVGIYAAKLIGDGCVTMVDIDEAAVAIARENTLLNDVAGIRVFQSNGFYSIDDTGYTVILSNPPYHTDFSIAKRFIEKGFNRLIIGGKMIMVTKRKDWYKNKFISIFGGVLVKQIDGYFVFTAEKRSVSYAKK
ncbi:MAG: methyltransferase [Clostridiales bacterium]|jgi:16S rRNA (guanine1207-N2)-methyltransferase|nr:methyltransferase [Clostridiales bacterium]